jgi:hypothetical protein
MLTYLEQKYSVQALNGRPGEFERLSKVVKELESQLAAEKADRDDNDTEKRSINSEEETDEDDEDDYVDDLPVEQTKKINTRGPRSSVSAEAFGSWNQRAAF